MTFKLVKGSGVPTKPYSEESLLGSGARNLARLGSRAVEEAVGLPGTIESVGRGALNLIDKGMGREPSVSSETFLPTPQNIREAVKSDTEGRLEPQGPWEKFADDVISNAVPLFIGGASALRSLITSGLGNLASVATKTITGSELGGDVVKAGTMLAIPLLGIPKSREVADNLYKAAESLLPEGATTSAEGLSPVLTKINKSLTRGLAETPGKKELSSIVAQLEDKIINNKIGVADLVQSKKDLGSIMASYDIKGIKGLLPGLQDSIKSTLQGYKSQNPEFIKNLNQADEVWHAIKTGVSISDFIKKSISPKDLNPKTAILLSLGASGAYIAPKTAALAVAGTGIYNALNNTLRSPTLRNIYLDVLKSAVKQNAVSLTKNVARLNKAIGKEETPKSSGARYKLVRG